MFAEGGRRKVPLHLLPSPTRMNPDVHVHANWLQLDYIYCIYMYNYKHIIYFSYDESLAAIYTAKMKKKLFCHFNNSNCYFKCILS